MRLFLLPKMRVFGTPQEGVFNGHFKPTEADKINRIGQLRMGVIKAIETDVYSPDIST